MRCGGRSTATVLPAAPPPTCGDAGPRARHPRPRSGGRHRLCRPVRRQRRCRRPLRLCRRPATDPAPTPSSTASTGRRQRPRRRRPARRGPPRRSAAPSAVQFHAWAPAAQRRAGTAGRRPVGGAAGAGPRWPNVPHRHGLDGPVSVVDELAPSSACAAAHRRRDDRHPHAAPALAGRPERARFKVAGAGAHGRGRHAARLRLAVAGLPIGELSFVVQRAALDHGADAAGRHARRAPHAAVGLCGLCPHGDRDEVRLRAGAAAGGARAGRLHRTRRSCAAARSGASASNVRWPPRTAVPVLVGRRRRVALGRLRMAADAAPPRPGRHRRRAAGPAARGAAATRAGRPGVGRAAASIVKAVQARGRRSRHPRASRSRTRRPGHLDRADVVQRLARGRRPLDAVDAQRTGCPPASRRPGWRPLLRMDAVIACRKRTRRTPPSPPRQRPAPPDRRDGVAVQPHREAELQHLGVGQARVGHVRLHHAGAVEAGAGAGAARDRLVVLVGRSLPKVKLFIVHWLAAITPRAPYSALVTHMRSPRCPPPPPPAGSG
jgi:hypothetical protein